MKEYKYFQPKIIIGSIGGFIATTIGTIAIFFPDLFNLQKKNLNELSVFIKEEKDVSKIWDFLIEHQGQFIKIEIGYCSDMNDGQVFFVNDKTDKNIDYITKKQEYFITQDKDMPLVIENLVKKDKNVEYGEWVENIPSRIPINFNIASFLAIKPALPEHSVDSDPAFDLKFNNISQYGLYSIYFEPIMKKHKKDFHRHEYVEVETAFKAHIYKTQQTTTYAGGFSTLFLENGGFGKEESIIEINESSENGKKYLWVLGEQRDLKLLADKQSTIFKEMTKTCKIREFPNNLDRDRKIQSQLMGYLHGYFFVEDLRHKNDTIYCNNGCVEVEPIGIELTPTSRKEFEMKNY